MVIHSPKEESVDSLEELLQKLIEPGTFSYNFLLH